VDFFQRDGFSEADVVDFHQEEKQEIRKVLTENFRIEDVGITFSGFKDCSKDIKADVPIIKFANLKPEAPAGFAIMGGQDATGVVINVIPSPARISSNQERLRLLILHEFGHVAGLGHEHEREEQLNDPNCSVDHNELIDPEVLENYNVYGAYDSNSVMNYCYLRKLNWVIGLNFSTPIGEELPLLLIDPSIYVQRRVGDFILTAITPKLSLGDRETLRCLYVYRGEDFKSRCRAL
jgi:hypothetical protein